MVYFRQEAAQQQSTESVHYNEHCTQYMTTNDLLLNDRALVLTQEPVQ
jgi:hypothetical protein